MPVGCWLSWGSTRQHTRCVCSTIQWFCIICNTRMHCSCMSTVAAHQRPNQRLLQLSLLAWLPALREYTKGKCGTAHSFSPVYAENAERRSICCCR